MLCVIAQAVTIAGNEEARADRRDAAPTGFDEPVRLPEVRWRE